MRINLHDFSGHPFQVHLSRELARRGHLVDHTYASQYVTGRGRLIVQDSDPVGLSITGLSTPVEFDKYHPTRRFRFEFGYADAWTDFLKLHRPDIVISCNVPLITMARMQRRLRSSNLPWVFWHQDIYSHGMSAEFRKILPFGGRRLGKFAELLEKQQIRSAAHVVPISESFEDQYARWGLKDVPSTVLPNWAPLDEIRPLPRDNAWSRAQNLPKPELRILYAGTLGRKHNPELLLVLLDKLIALGVEATLVVCSEGVGADYIAAKTSGRANVRILGFQPSEDLEQVLSSADVVVAILEPDASEFSVPSKVLSYLAAGRPIVGLMPNQNPAANDIRQAGGFVAKADSDGAESAAAWVARVAADREHLAVLGKQARSLAEERFDITSIADTFESILTGIVESSPTGPVGA